MKKLLIGMLLIIPVIVILIVSATASIVSGAHIAVESVIIYKPEESGNGIVEVNEPILAYISDVGIQLQAIVYPLQATEKGVEWSVENETVALGANVLAVDSDGYVSFKGLGTADVVVTAEGNIKARCKIMVTSSDVMGISITDNVPLAFAVGERYQLEAALYPADAQTSQRYLDWSVTSGNAVSVDKNGIISAESEGTATVRASLKNPPENLSAEKRFAEIEITVICRATTEIFDYDQVLYTSGDGCNLEQLLNPEYSSDGAVVFSTDVGTVSANKYLTVDFNGGNSVKATVTATDNSKEESIEITFKKIAFRNGDMWSRLDGEDKVYLTLGSAGTYLEVLSSLSGVTVTSSDPTVAEIENGWLVPKKAGETVVTAAKGSLTESITFKVLPPVYGVTLVYDNSDDAMGVEMTRVFGSKTYADGALTNKLKFDISSVYTVVDGANKIVTSTDDIAKYAYLLKWEIDSASAENGFTVSQNGVLTTGDATAATVKLKAKYPLYESVEISASYTAKFIENGVNVGIVSKKAEEDYAASEMMAQQIEDAKNASVTSGFDYVNALAKAQYDATGLNDDYAIVLHSDIVMNKVDKLLYCSLYGNGYILREMKESDISIFGAKDFATLKIVLDNVTVQNARIRAARALNADESLYEYRFGGNGITVDGREKYFRNGVENSERLTNININYVIVENCYYCVYVAAADVNITGAIVRNSGAQSLYINTSVQDVGNGTDKKLMNAVVNLKNCVFTNAINMSIGIITEDLDPSYDEQETVEVNGESVTRPKYVSYFEHVTKSVLDLDGFCDIYNWKSSKELDFTFVSEYGIDGEWVGSIVRSLIDDEESWSTLSSMLKGIDLNKIRAFNSDGVAEYQLAIGNVGVHYPMSGYIPEEDKVSVGLTGVVGMDISEFSYIAPGKNIGYPLEFYCYDVNNPTIGPDDVCVVNSELFERMKQN